MEVHQPEPFPESRQQARSAAFGDLVRLDTVSRIRTKQIKEIEGFCTGALSF
jgi:hypothetical protein